MTYIKVPDTDIYVDPETMKTIKKGEIEETKTNAMEEKARLGDITDEDKEQFLRDNWDKLAKYQAIKATETIIARCEEILAQLT